MMTEGSDRCRIGRHGAAGLILLDTCEPGTRTDGYTCARIEGPASFTSAVLNALKNGDGDQDGSIQVSEIVAHVQDVVHSLAHVLARAVSQTELVFGVQTPRLFLARKFPTAENTA